MLGHALSNSYVGTPRLGYNQEWATHVVHFNQFGTLSTWVTGEIVQSPEFMLVGNQWRVEMYPSEDEISYPRSEDEISDEAMVSFYLQNMSNNTIDVEYGFSVKDRGGKQLVITTHHTFDPTKVCTTTTLLRAALSSAAGASTLRRSRFY